ncbi:hypothetical protein ACMD2_16403 [Ananas comosus]|uniref:Pre-rRNA-processing protein RIX1 N-terminal domain-containing protein n=1 Tax=Ananas comosus TaxID=4615 RepID=A0A199VUJ2_ANACO|nr:hypothetical protein ACMD2_16403 [Ananas comosus]
MAIAGFVEGMGDHKLKPRLLSSLVRERLPGGDGAAGSRPSPSPAELSSVLAAVKTHGLLAEAAAAAATAAGRPDPELAESWRGAVDAWADRVLSLVSSNAVASDKRWAGACLLGVTVEECSSERFVASYSLWFQKLLPNIQQPSTTYFVKVASCAALADLFTRLANFSNLKKDSTSFAGKLVQPVLQLLNEDGPFTLWVEATLVSKIISEKTVVHLITFFQKFAFCLALLPKARGDEESWSLLMQKLLIVITKLVDDAFQGLEDEAKSSEVMKLLVPPGKGTPPPLGGQQNLEERSHNATRRLRDYTIPTISTLIHCCCMMLTNPYLVQVNVPLRPLLAVIRRVLSMDGSLSRSLLPFTTALDQELLCSELPFLHLDFLNLLISTIKGVRSQFLPHAATVVRLLIEFFRRAKLPSIRIKVYYIMQMLLISMGIGVALYIAEEVIKNAFADLDDSSKGNSLFPSACTSIVSEAVQQNSSRKRKNISRAPLQQCNSIGSDIAPDAGKMVAPLSVKIAALKALEALLTVGGSLDSLRRPDVDRLLITVATKACELGWGYEGNSAVVIEESGISRADFQLAALKALLASLLSLGRGRPPYLSLGLELFRRGKLETGTELATFCAHALLALELLIHPRALPLEEPPTGKSSMPGSIFHASQNPNLLSSTSSDREAIRDSKLYFNWSDPDGEQSDDDDSMEDARPEKFARVDVPPAGHRIEQGDQEKSPRVNAEMASPSYSKETKDADMVESNNSKDPSSHGTNVLPDVAKRVSPVSEATTVVGDLDIDKFNNLRSDVSKFDSILDSGDFTNNNIAGKPHDSDNNEKAADGAVRILGKESKTDDSDSDSDSIPEIRLWDSDSD